MHDAIRLTQTAHDLIAIVSVFGFALTVIGVWLTWYQMRKATSATQAASNAAVAALAESRGQYNRFLITQLHRLLSEARIYVDCKNWDAAAIRLGDIVELLLHVANTEPLWSESARNFQAMQLTFQRISQQELNFTKALASKWNRLDRSMRETITCNLRPFKIEE